MRANGMRLCTARPFRMSDDQRDVHGLSINHSALLAQPVRTGHLTAIRGIDNDGVLRHVGCVQRIYH